jgi:hypothetical protein
VNRWTFASRRLIGTLEGGPSQSEETPAGGPSPFLGGVAAHTW